MSRGFHWDESGTCISWAQMMSHYPQKWKLFLQWLNIDILVYLCGLRLQICVYLPCKKIYWFKCHAKSGIFWQFLPNYCTLNFAIILEWSNGLTWNFAEMKSAFSTSKIWYHQIIHIGKYKINFSIKTFWENMEKNAIRCHFFKTRPYMCNGAMVFYV